MKLTEHATNDENQSINQNQPRTDTVLELENESIKNSYYNHIPYIRQVWGWSET